MAFRILSVIQVRTTLGCHPLSIYTILARATIRMLHPRGVLRDRVSRQASRIMPGLAPTRPVSRSRLCHRAKTEHDLLGRLLGDARKKNHTTTARASVAGHACAVRIRIVQAAGGLVLVENPLGSILEHLFHGNA